MVICLSVKIEKIKQLASQSYKLKIVKMSIKKKFNQ